MGIDGVPFTLMNDLSDKGVMPNFNELKKEFPFRILKSSIPHISSVSWSSIITGKNPGEHGIFGFTDLIQNTYSISFPNFNALKSKPFWQQDLNKNNIIINVPATYPAKELNGIHIAGFVALELEKAVYPKTILPKLKEFKYEIDVDSSLAHEQSIDIFFNELFKVLNIRRKTFEYFWDYSNWNNFMPVITGSDRIGHFFWEIYENPKNSYHYRFLDYFQEIDTIIGDIKNKLKENDKFIIISDHGMELIEHNVNLNTYLEKEGLLKLSEKGKRYNRIEKGTMAFILEPGRVYLNRKGIFPNGTIEKHEEKEAINQLKDILFDLEFENQKILRNVYKKEEIYAGKMIDSAPDLVLVENKGFNLKGSIGKENIIENENTFSGKHNDNSFILINDELDIENPTVENIIGLME
ncbi:MAG: alkaline phosphatase family protein [Promethearchaeota archaeon]